MIKAQKHLPKSLALLKWGLVLLTCLLVGCASTPKKGYKNYLYEGNIPEAENILNGINANNDKLLREVQLASIAQLKSDFKSSNNHLETGKKLAEELAAISVTETLAAISINQRVSKFSGNRFERIMIYFNKALNYIASNDAAAARIEISQAEILMQEWRIGVERFPFIPLFLALIYEKIGDIENSLVAYRRAAAAYKSSESTPDILKKGYLQLLAKYGRQSELARASLQLKAKVAASPNKASLIIVVPRGFMTPMDSFTVYNFHPEINKNFLIALPLYSEYSGVRAAPLLSLKQQAKDSANVIFENMVNVELGMRAALKRQMPAITTLALARAVVKSQLQQQTEENSAASFLVFVFNTVTEVADTRSWDTLPQAFYFSRLELDPGSYSLNYADREPMNVSIKKGVNFLFLPNYR